MRSHRRGTAKEQRSSCQDNMDPMQANGDTGQNDQQKQPGAAAVTSTAQAASAAMQDSAPLITADAASAEASTETAASVEDGKKRKRGAAGANKTTSADDDEASSATAAATDKKKKRKKAGGSGGGRQQEFNSQEIYLECQAYEHVCCSGSGATGTNQSKDTIWGDIKKYYDLLREATIKSQMDRDGIVTTSLPERTEKALRNLWYGSIMPATNKFAGICEVFSAESGENDERTFYQKRCTIYEQHAKKKDWKPKSFKRFLPAYKQILSKETVKFSSHWVKDQSGPQHGGVKKAKPRPTKGRDRTKLDKKASQAAEKVAQSLAGQLADEAEDKYKYRSEVCTALKQLAMQQVMQFAPPDKRDQYFKTMAEAAMIDAENTKKKAELEQININNELDVHLFDGEFDDLYDDDGLDDKTTNNKVEASDDEEEEGSTDDNKCGNNESKEEST